MGILIITKLEQKRIITILSSLLGILKSTGQNPEKKNLVDLLKLELVKLNFFSNVLVNE